MSNFIYGFHAIEEQLKTGHLKGKLLVARQSKRALGIIDLAHKKHIPVIQAADEELDRYCNPDKHRGLLFLLQKKTSKDSSDFKTIIRELRTANPLVLLLDSITDPHNFGAILRSADQFYADLVVTTEKRSARKTETVAVTSAGAHVYVNRVIVVNLVHVIDFLKTEGYWVYGADMHGVDVQTVNLKGKTALALGSEGKGLRPLVKEKCDQLIKIPAKGHVDSLNVSVAAGVLMYETRRQQKFT